MTFQRQDMDASLLRHAQRFPKLRVGSVIGLKAGHALHLDDEHDPRSETLCLGGDQPLMCLMPRSVGASGNLATPFSSRVTPLISAK